MRLAAALAALGLAGGAAVAGPVQPRPHHVVTNPDWLVKPDAETYSRYYPAAAQMAGVSGRAVILCTVAVTGHLDDCRVVSEDPPGYNFGEAALKLGSLSLFKPATRDGEPYPAVVRIPFSFSGPPGPAPPGTYYPGPISPQPPAPPAKDFAPGLTTAPPPAIAALSAPMGRLGLAASDQRRVYFLALDGVSREGDRAEGVLVILLDRAPGADPAQAFYEVHRIGADCRSFAVTDLGGRAFNAAGAATGWTAPSDGPLPVSAVSPWARAAAALCEPAAHPVEVIGVAGAMAFLHRGVRP